MEKRKTKKQDSSEGGTSDRDKKKEEKAEIKEQEIKEEEEKKTQAEKPGEKKDSDKKEVKKPKKQETKPKDKAVVDVRSIGLSPKHCFAICKLIKGKAPEQAIRQLGLVLKEKKPVPMKGEIPHRGGKVMSGRFPKKASTEMIKLLKQVNANALVNGIEDPVITIAKADKASRPFRRRGRRAKRAHVYLEVKERSKNGRKKVHKG